MLEDVWRKHEGYIFVVLDFWATARRGFLGCARRGKGSRGGAFLALGPSILGRRSIKTGPQEESTNSYSKSSAAALLSTRAGITSFFDR